MEIGNGNALMGIALIDHINAMVIMEIVLTSVMKLLMLVVSKTFN